MFQCQGRCLLCFVVFVRVGVHVGVAMDVDLAHGLQVLLRCAACLLQHQCHFCSLHLRVSSRRFPGI